MRVLEASEKLITNAEVYAHLNDVKTSSRCENLQTIVVELQAYLRERPAGNPSDPQSFGNIAAFMGEMKKRAFALEKSEYLQIINSAPSSLPSLFCLIEEADIRFTQTQLEEILELSCRFLGSEPTPSD